MSTRILVIGDGRMGRAVSQVAADRGCAVVGMLGPNDTPAGIGTGVADVAIEFTQPDAAAGVVRACLAAGLPVVSGTTGWDTELEKVRAECLASGGSMLHSPNFSVGVHLFRKVVAEAARQAAGTSFDVHIVETHHTAKLDAPSGTARALARDAASALGKDVPVTSVRVGRVPGTHELILDGQFEQIRLVHEARDRRVFADGAVTAALWLVGKTGVFGMEDVVSLSP